MEKILYRNRKIKLLLCKLKKLNKICLQEKELLKKEYATFPKETIHIKKVDSYYACYKQKGSTETSISKNHQSAQFLARKMQAISEIDDINVSLDVLGNAINTLEKHIISQKTKKGHATLDKLQDFFGNILFALNIKEISLIKKFTRDANWYSEGLKYVTKCGIAVRSKSEMIIADILYSYGILFLYEPTIQVGDRVLHPDFLIIRSDGSIIIWEHFGLFDEPEYKEKMIEKMELYGKNGFDLHTNLIFTTEKDITKKEVLEKIVEERLI